MKKIILLLVVLFVFSCDSGGGGSSEPETNCDICPHESLSLLTVLTDASTDYAAEVGTAQVGTAASADYVAASEGGHTWTAGVADTMDCDDGNGNMTAACNNAIAGACSSGNTTDEAACDLEDDLNQVGTAASADYAAASEDWIAQVGTASVFTCSHDELSNLGCVNIIEAVVNETTQTITIYYNVDFNISGFQFRLNDISINNITSFIPDSFTIANNDSEIIAYNITGDVISNRCGMLLTVDYTPSTAWDSSDFISNIVFTGDIYTDNIPNSIDVCNN